MASRVNLIVSCKVSRHFSLPQLSWLWGLSQDRQKGKGIPSMTFGQSTRNRGTKQCIKEYHHDKVLCLVSPAIALSFCAILGPIMQYSARLNDFFN